MGNAYQEEVNGLVDEIMKIADEASSSQEMEKDAGIKDVFSRKKKPAQAMDIAGNKATANEMFAGMGGDDSASDSAESTPRKWKRIKAKFFKKANENTEAMIEKIAAASGADLDLLLEYIEKSAAENDMDGQDVVDILYEDVEDVEDEDIEDEDIEDEDIEDENDEDEDYEEDEEMVNEAVEKVAYAAGVDEDTVLDYIEKVAYENDVDELEVLAALEKEAGPKFDAAIKNVRGAGSAVAGFAGKHKKPLLIGGGTLGVVGTGLAGKKAYDRYKAKKAEAAIAEAAEKVAYVNGVETEDVYDYVEKVAYENDMDELEVLAALAEEI